MRLFFCRKSFIKGTVNVALLGVDFPTFGIPRLTDCEGKKLPWEEGKDDELTARDDGLTEVTVRYGFRGPAKDRCEHQGEAVRTGELLDVKPGDELALGELTFAWLVKQSLVAVKG